MDFERWVKIVGTIVGMCWLVACFVFGFFLVQLVANHI